jgi:hypothetical protein
MLPIDSEPTRSKVVTTTPDGILVTKHHQPTADAKRLTSFLNQKEFPKTSFLPATGEVGLALARSKLTDAGLSHVASLKHLESLSLEDCAGVTSAGMQHLVGLSELRHLTLRGTGVRFDGLTQLAANTKLTTLNILTTQASAADVEKLRKSLPNCEIVAIPPNPSG